MSPRVTEIVDLWFNEKWINYQMKEGKTLVDIGEVAGDPPSKYYDFERQQVDGCSGYVSDAQP